MARVTPERRHPPGALPADRELGVGLATGGADINLAGGMPIAVEDRHVGGIAARGGMSERDGAPWAGTAPLAG
jgi:uncharacterized protein GlcG (DUF336 family)